MKELYVCVYVFYVYFYVNVRVAHIYRVVPVCMSCVDLFLLCFHSHLSISPTATRVLLARHSLSFPPKLLKDTSKTFSFSLVFIIVVLRKVPGTHTTHLKNYDTIFLSS